MGRKADTVTALFVDVKFRRDARFAKREVEQHAVLRRHARVFVGVEQECRRRFASHLSFVR